MIHKVIFLASLLFVTKMLSAQSFSVGFRAGYTLADVDFREVKDVGILFEAPNKKVLNGFHAGLDGRIEFNERWAVLTGMQFNRKGYRSELYWPSGPAVANYFFQYLTIPVVGDFRIWRGLSVQAGMEAGILLDARLKSAGENVDLEDNGIYTNFDSGVVAGLEYQVHNFFIGARYTLGLINLFKDIRFTDHDGNEIHTGAHNRAAQFSAGYRYPFGK
ncbi:MAG: hypothetical protein EPGJADBJ_04061 [Saprospiraceae bacterium]|nr:hypothetical protein [Saprospiraceae bacterium]